MTAGAFGDHHRPEGAQHGALSRLGQRLPRVEFDRCARQDPREVLSDAGGLGGEGVGGLGAAGRAVCRFRDLGSDSVWNLAAIYRRFDSPK